MNDEIIDIDDEHLVFQGQRIVHLPGASTVEHVERGGLYFVLIVTADNACHVLCLKDNGQVIWQKAPGEHGIYDIDGCFSIDILEEERAILVYSFSYVFILSQEDGTFIRLDYNK